MADSAPFVRPDVRAFLDMLAAMNRPELGDMPLPEARASMLMMRDIADLPAVPLAVIRDLTCPGPGGDIPLRLYDARDTREPGPVLVFYHGGGFVVGDLDSHHNLCTELAAAFDLPLVAVDYRLAPEHPFPAAPDDCEAATRWVAGSPAELGRTVTGLILLGDSAGGNMTLVTAQSLLLDPAAVPVVLQVPIYPLCDDMRQHPSYAEMGEGYLLTENTIDFFDRAYAADTSDRRAYPALGPIAGLPPTLLVTASLDPLRDSGRSFVGLLAAHGVDTTFIECRGAIHGFVQVRKAIPSAQVDVLAIVAAARTMLERIA